MSIPNNRSRDIIRRHRLFENIFVTGVSETVGLRFVSERRWPSLIARDFACSTGKRYWRLARERFPVEPPSERDCGVSADVFGTRRAVAGGAGKKGCDRLCGFRRTGIPNARRTCSVRDGRPREGLWNEKIPGTRTGQIPIVTPIFRCSFSLFGALNYHNPFLTGDE